MSKKYFIFTGEASGDLHGSRLIKALHEKDPSITIFGVGGPRIRQENFTCMVKMEQFQVMGFTDVFKSLPRLVKLFYFIRNQIILEQPDKVILIDYPGFNLRLARSLRKKGYKGKIIQYICPTVWAHGKKRLNDLAQNFDLVLSIYPFESELLENHSIPSIYIGNPLKDNLKSFSFKNSFYELFKLKEQDSLIALFPGSRLQEIRKHIPTQLEVAAKLKTKYPHLIFAISCAHVDLLAPIEEYIKKSPLSINKDIWIIPSSYTHELMKNCQLALAKSGTVTLELALHKTPTVVHYQASSLNYFIAKYIIKIRLAYFCIVNILKNQKVFPEFIGKETYIPQIYKEMDRLLSDSNAYEKVIAECEMIKDLLGKKSSHEEAAKAIEVL